jgi:trans-2-enoyl-CoA reductase
MSKYLDQEGVQALWSKIKDRDTKRDNYFNYKDEFIPLNG